MKYIMVSRDFNLHKDAERAGKELSNNGQLFKPVVLHFPNHSVVCRAFNEDLDYVLEHNSVNQQWVLEV